MELEIYLCMTKMNCWHCNSELIWGGDEDMEEDTQYSMVTNLSCPKCFTLVEVYLPRNAYD